MTTTTSAPVTPAGGGSRRPLVGVLAFVVSLALLVGGALAGGVWWLSHQGVLPLFQVCSVTANSRTVGLDREQARNAATVAAVAGERGVSQRGLLVAYATAYQESDLRNLDYGDRDSLGVFQQRPSQGWGTAEEVRDVRYAAGRFFDELATVPYEDLSVTEAAQAVQRSGFPDAYAKHEGDARTLAAAFSGAAPAAVSCRVTHGALESERVRDSGFTPRARTVRQEVRSVFGPLPATTYRTAAGDGVHDRGLAVDLFVPMADGRGSAEGWALAHWLVANADRLAVATVIYDDRLWTAARSGEGWREYRHPSGSTTVTDRHLDHVHVDVVAGG
jgi:hypothetical protein